MKQLLKPVAVVFAMLGLLLLQGCAGHVDRAGVVWHGDNTRVAVVFGDDDRRIIHDYYHRYRDRHRHGRGLPPGLAKREHLPPGLARQVRRNGTLPPGLERRSLPHDLERRLRPLPAGYVRIQVGGDIVLMNERTRVMVDVIKDIVP